MARLVAGSRPWWRTASQHQRPATAAMSGEERAAIGKADAEGAGRHLPAAGCAAAFPCSGERRPPQATGIDGG
jgi:hypothetical protein